MFSQCNFVLFFELVLMKLNKKRTYQKKTIDKKAILFSLLLVRSIGLPPPEKVLFDNPICFKNFCKITFNMGLTNTKKHIMGPPLPCKKPMKKPTVRENCKLSCLTQGSSAGLTKSSRKRRCVRSQPTPPARRSDLHSATVPPGHGAQLLCAARRHAVHLPVE